MNTLNKPSDYRAIEIWGRRLGSFDSYIKMEQKKAALDNAPITAIYKRGEIWRTVNDIENNAVLKEMIDSLVTQQK
jgi:hypothetical protein